jgi:hypothetical protein
MVKEEKEEECGTHTFTNNYSGRGEVEGRSEKEGERDRKRER